ncbi:hypothetical protein ACQEVX_14925 [Streptomyces syringium]|uniref:hypothetical protein n=1 Tax=Streptomyces syringium TaxID=76729 RepID=UPI003D8DEDDC
MRTAARVFTGTALSIAAVALAGAPALAAGTFEKLEVSPGSVQPGATVTVSTTACGRDGAGTGDASAVGGPASFQLKTGTHKEAVVGQFKAPMSAKPGTYGIGVNCKNGREATGDLVVTKGSDAVPPAPAPAPSPATSSPAQAPQGGMKTGVGGASESGSGTAEIAAGAAVLTTAALGGTWFLRRRESDDRV